MIEVFTVIVSIIVNIQRINMFWIDIDIYDDWFLHFYIIFLIFLYERQILQIMKDEG